MSKNKEEIKGCKVSLNEVLHLNFNLMSLQLTEDLKNTLQFSREEAERLENN